MLTLLLCALPLWAPCPQDPAEQFIREFGMAMRVNDTRAQDLTLRRNRRVASDYFINHIVTVKGPQNLWVVAFTEAWKRVYRSDFPLLYITKIHGLSAADFKIRATATGAGLIELNKLSALALETKSPKDWETFRESGLPLEKMFEGIGDLYFQAVVLEMLCESYLSDFQDGPGDSKKSYEFLLKLRGVLKTLDLENHLQFAKGKAHFERLRYELGLEPESTQPRVISPFEIPVAEGEQWHRLDLSFAYEKKYDGIVHSSDKSTGMITDWFAIGIQEKESTEFFRAHCDSNDCIMGNANSRNKDSRIKLVRDRLNLFHIEAGGEPSEPFALKTEPVLVTVEQKLPGGELKSLAFWVATGKEKGGINGVEMNQGMKEYGGLMYFRPATIRRAKTPWGEFRYYDTNYDSLYGEWQPSLAAPLGAPKGLYSKRFDAISIGRAKYSLPASPYFPNEKGDWFQIECPKGPAPSFLKIRKVAPTFGKFKIVAKGFRELKLTTLILKSLTPETEGLYVEIGAGKPTKNIPIGNYELIQGYLRGKEGQSALILPPDDSLLIFSIDAGGTETFEMGAPFRLHGSFRVENDEILLDGDRIYVTGKSGERYLALNGAPLNRLTIQVKGGKKGETEPATTEMASKDWNAAFFPAPFRLPLPKRGEPMIKISLKKHPWFGKLSSDWIE